MTKLFPIWLAWQLFQLIPAPYEPAAVVLVVALSFVAVFTVAAGVKVACHVERERNARHRRHIDREPRPRLHWGRAFAGIADEARKAVRRHG